MIYNRPHTTGQVFQQIRNSRPAKLLIIADGHRAGRPADVTLCAAARATVNNIDWDCEVLRNYSAFNMGCKQRVASGLDWVFNQVEEAIILEDDCLPHPTFFRYCQELLDRYRTYERIMSISGSNWQFGQQRTPYSYYLSRYFQPWGWAGWRRAWQYYDVNATLWPLLSNCKWLYSPTDSASEAAYWQRVFSKVYLKLEETWDYQNILAGRIQNGVTICPNVNLISNIGYGPGATHTFWEKGKVTSRLPTQGMDFPLNHPPFIMPDREADEFVRRLIAAGRV